jgi:hypothetical protein
MPWISNALELIWWLSLTHIYEHRSNGRCELHIKIVKMNEERIKILETWILPMNIKCFGNYMTTLNCLVIILKGIHWHFIYRKINRTHNMTIKSIIPWIDHCWRAKYFAETLSVQNEIELSHIENWIELST